MTGVCTNGQGHETHSGSELPQPLNSIRRSIGKRLEVSKERQLLIKGGKIWHG